MSKTASPTQKSFLGKLVHLALGTWRRTRRCNVGLLSASLAFTTVISLVPLLAVSLSVFKAYGGLEELVKKVEPYILQDFVDASGVHLSDFIHSAIKRVESGVLGIGGSIALFFTSTKLLLDLETAVHWIWKEPSIRINIRRLLVYWIFMFFGPLAIAALLGVLGSQDLGMLARIPRQTLAFLFTFFACFCVNWYLPTRWVRFRSAFLSGLVTAIGISLAQQFYAQITHRLLRYGKIYGSLASIPIFLMWILVLWWIFFGGVALCATLEEPVAPEQRKRVPKARRTVTIATNGR